PTFTDSMGNVQPNPYYNPYVTIDYLGGVVAGVPTIPLNAATTMTYASRGKQQPYASDSGKIDDQTAGATNTKNTFGATNSNAATTSDWLLHLDRTPVSPIELMLVSSFRPHELTHQFITGGKKQQQRTMWFDEDLTAPQSHRLWRLFSFLEVADRAARNSP